jgi:hypothetical protein
MIGQRRIGMWSVTAASYEAKLSYSAPFLPTFLVSGVLDPFPKWMHFMQISVLV